MTINWCRKATEFHCNYPTLCETQAGRMNVFHEENMAKLGAGEKKKRSLAHWCWN